MGTSVLVTGGAGYVGSHAVAALLEHGHDVTVLDNLSTGHRAAVPDGARLVVGDLSDKAAILSALGESGATAVMHFAALSLAGESAQQPFRYLRSNTLAMLNLVECAVERSVERFVLSSTANLFDEPDKIPIDERCPVVPGSPYGESKHFAERILLWAERLHGLRCACLRYFNAAGADPSGARGEHHDPETHLIPIVLQVALGQRDEVQIFGEDYPTPDGTCIRDYVHVTDLAQAHILALGALEDHAYLQYNLGSGNGFSVKEVIEMARAVTGHAIPATVGPRRLGDPDKLVASSDRIRRELGWRPQYSDLKVIVETAWRWHSANPSGYAASAP